jgi:hypothetical protein
MKTVVYQSFRSDAVRGPVARCVATVEAWAKLRGFAYRFLGDELFDRVPDWFRDRVAGNRLSMSDLARLKVARELLDEGADRAVWVDADVVVFDPGNFDIAIEKEYAFCREVWIRRGGGGKLLATEGLHNAVCVFARGNSFLDFYIHAACEIVRAADAEVVSQKLGPDFLSRLKDVIGDRVLGDVGLFSPIVTADIARGGGRAAAAYMKAFGHPIRAANLCLSFVGRNSGGVTLTETMLDRAIDRLLESRGEVVNGLLDAER